MTQGPAFDTALETALDVFERGGLVAYPTETVWGLGACADSASAVDGLRAWKGRSDTKPISVLVGDVNALETSGFVVSDLALRLVEAFWPGPLTLVLRCRATLAPGIANADGAVGVRCSPHPIAGALALGAQARGLGPITATSLNKAGEPAAAVIEEARRVCVPDASPEAAPGPWLFEPGRADAAGAEPSSVVDVSGGRVRLLRAGAISRAALAEVVGGEIDEAPLT